MQLIKDWPSAFVIISSIIFQEVSSWGLVMQNCSTFLDWCTLKYTPGVSAMGPHLLVEAGGVSDVALRELLRLHPLLPV